MTTAANPAPHCCKIGCDAPAEWEVQHHPYRPDDYTHACPAHVGELLTDAPEHRVYPVEPPAAQSGPPS